MNCSVVLIGLAIAAWQARLAEGPGVATRRLGPNSHVVAAEVHPAVLRAEAERIAVMEKARHPVLAIFSAAGGGGGSGVVISPDGYALTNFHVAFACGTFMKCGMPDGRVYDAVIVGIDPTGDVALVKLLGREDFPWAELADSDRAEVGDWVFAMGNPFLLATDFQPTVTYGILSGVHRYQYPAGTLLEYADCLQTDASINPGNSGGPLFDAAGRLIGINGRASFEKRGRVNVGVGYAISINQIKNFLGHLRSGRIVDHATLGATVAFDDQNRVIVSDILEHSDAYRRGLRYGDEIISFAGRPIQTPNAFKNVLGILPKGWRVPLSYRRDGKRFDVLVRLAGVHSESELLEKVSRGARKPPMPIPKSKPEPGDRPGNGRGPKPLPQKGGEQPTPDVPVPVPPPEGGPLDPHRPEPAVPDAVKRFYETKRGYANYYFNRLHRDRVWKAWVARAGLGHAVQTWTISGPLEGGGRYRLQIADDQVVLTLPQEQMNWLATDELGLSPAPPNSGGLFAALWLWRRLAVGGPDKYGDVSYLGTAPWPGCDDLLDVLVGLHGGVECRFYFDPKTGLLAGLEMFAEEHADPCEVYFGDYHDLAGRQLPQRMEVRFGNEVFATFRIEGFQLGN
ncbi:MAG: trypsin-like peptidase domain-containing protein [Thermoguttaceae bacterium]